jgi:hypothetical protein
MYPLCWIMVALYSHSSIALNSVAGESVDFALATMGVSPTVIIASSSTLSNYHKDIMLPYSGFISKIAHWIQSRSLEAGCMPSRNLLSQLAYIGPTAEISLERLRLLMVSFRVDDDTENCLSCDQLTDLRIFTNSRILYALTGPGIAGAVAQTHVFDYRKYDGPTHFGAPSSSLEITLTGHQEDSGLERAVEGQVRYAFKYLSHWSYMELTYGVLHRLLSPDQQFPPRKLFSQLVDAFGMITPYNCARNDEICLVWKVHQLEAVK